MQVNFKMDALPEHKHLVDRYFEGLEEVGIQNDGKGLDFYVDANIKDKSNQIIKKLDKYCCLVLGANYYTKRIPLEKCMEIVDKSNLHVMLIGGKDVAPIASALNNTYPEKIINMCGQINIQQSAVMIKSAEYIITGDTGMMHIAAAYQKRIYVLWGNTIPAFGMYPYYGNKYPDRHVDLEVPDLKCRPCSKLGYNSCPKDHFACMMNQNVRQIISP